MQTLKFRAKIDSIQGNEIHYALPQHIYESEIKNLDEPRVIDPANPKREFLELAKSTYVGSKRRLRKKIVSLVPDEVHSCFDPMAGFSSILRELGEQGKEIWGNDLNLVSYYYSRALFLKAKPSEQEFKAFLESIQEREGYFAKCDFWKSIKIPMSYKRFIDGFILKAQENENPSFYLGVAANYLSSACGSLGGPYHPRAAGHFLIGALKHDLLRDMEEISKCKAVGKFTSLDARTMEFPDVDLIYFDPPYYEADPTYFKRYSKINSILAQKDWDLPSEINQKEVEEIGKKLSHHCDLLLISSTAKCPISWKDALSDPRREVTQKKFTLTGTGLDKAAVTMNRRALSEHLWISAKKSLVEVVKAADPFMIYPPEDKEYKYMMHIHFRGKSAHGDLRIEALQKQYLLGWTLMLQRVGAIKEPVLTMGEARKEIADSKNWKINLQTGEWAHRMRRGTKKTVNVSIVSTKKSPEPLAWAGFSGLVKPGEIGATSEFPGVFVIVDRGKAEYGSSKPWLHEYFLDGKVFKRGRYFFRQLETWKTKKAETFDENFVETIESEKIWEEISYWNREAIEILKNDGMTEAEVKKWIAPQLIEVKNELDLSEEEIMKAFVIPPGKEEGLGKGELGWLMINPIDQVPYVISGRAEKENWLPPKDFSALPHHWRKHVLSEEEYWKLSGAKALDARKALRQRLRKEDVLSKAEEGEVDPFGVKKDLITEALAPEGVDSLIPEEKPTIPKDDPKQPSLAADFRLTYQWWKKVKVIREGPSKAQYHIWFRTSEKKVLDFLINDSILEVGETGGILHKDRTEIDFETEGYVKPGTKLNPTKATPSFIKPLDRGKAVMLIDMPNLKKVQFKGSKLKGTFLFKNVEGYWEIKRVQIAPEKKDWELKKSKFFPPVNKRIDQLEIGEITTCRQSGRYRGVSIGRDKNGYFVCTHRARSKSYKEAIKIPVSMIAWIKSTG